MPRALGPTSAKGTEVGDDQRRYFLLSAKKQYNDRWIFGCGGAGSTHRYPPPRRQAGAFPLLSLFFSVFPLFFFVFPLFVLAFPLFFHRFFLAFPSLFLSLFLACSLPRRGADAINEGISYEGKNN